MAETAQINTDYTMPFCSNCGRLNMNDLANRLAGGRIEETDDHELVTINVIFIDRYEYGAGLQSRSSWGTYIAIIMKNLSLNHWRFAQSHAAMERCGHLGYYQFFSVEVHSEALRGVGALECPLLEHLQLDVRNTSDIGGHHAFQRNRESLSY